MKIVSYLIILFFIFVLPVFAEEQSTQTPIEEDWLYSVDSRVILKKHVPRLSIKPSQPFDEKKKSAKDDDRYDYDDVHNVVDKKRKKRGPEFSETQKGLDYDQFHEYMKADVFEPGGKIKKVKYDYSSKEETKK